MAEPVKYVPFGGAQVPESAKREVIDRNGQKIYCVWTNDKGGKVTYPYQQTYNTSDKVYKKHIYNNYKKVSTEYTSKNEFYALKTSAILTCENIKPENNGVKFSYSSDYVGVQFTNNGKYSGNRWDVTREPLDINPTITINAETGTIYDTQNITLSNMRGATVTGSSDEDNITLMNSSNCTVDVSNANNNMFVSDNVKVVNGQGNEVKTGNHDQITFRTFNYETATETTKANHKGEGTYKQ